MLAQARDLSKPMRERFEARQKLAMLPPDANPNRIRNQGRRDRTTTRIHQALRPFPYFIPRDGARRAVAGCPESESVTGTGPEYFAGIPS